MEEFVPRLLLTMFVWLIAMIAGVFFYLYRMERIPGLRFSQALGVLMICRLLDMGSFGLAFRESGGEIAAAEVNLGFLLLTKILPSETVLLVTLVLTTAGIGVALVVYHRLMVAEGLSVSEASRMTLAATAAISVISLFGAATNFFFAVFGWASPLLI